LTNLKSYVELDCPNLDIISKKIYDFVEDKLNTKEGWLFLDTIQILKSVPELMLFFKQHRLYPKHSAITILNDDFKLHIDAPPTIAKINFPILNTDGWVIRWYDIDPVALKNCSTVVDEFGCVKEDIRQLPESAVVLASELYEFKKPIVFNSRMLHSVTKINPATYPRIVASFTFANQPLHMLTCE
jgi:hypothetical protein